MPVRQNRLLKLLSVSVAAATLAACTPKPTGPMVGEGGPDYDRPLPPGQLALRKITDPAQIPDFTAAFSNTADLRRAVERSLSYLSKPSSRNFYPYGREISHDRVVRSLEAFLALLESGLDPAEMNQAIRESFDVYTSVGWDGRGTVLFTGYYTPIFNASRERTERFRYPLYQPPEDLVKGENGEILGRRTASGALEPYPTREQIQGSDLLDGRELVYLEDPFEVYIAHVQGSALLRLPSGERITVGYAASNGAEYESVGLALVADGKIPADQLSLQTMMDYFDAHPEQVDTYTARNPRFVFFTLGEGLPRGSLNEEVTPLRTIATDKSIYPRAALGLIRTRLPMGEGGRIRPLPYSGFVLDQDTGGAIRAPGRCDVYMGVGENAGARAGRTREEGRMYYLFLR
jgi:membrane-bound lytic murein transglycosylase A